MTREELHTALPTWYPLYLKQGARLLAGADPALEPADCAQEAALAVLATYRPGMYGDVAFLRRRSYGAMVDLLRRYQDWRNAGVYVFEAYNSAVHDIQDEQSNPEDAVEQQDIRDKIRRAATGKEREIVDGLFAGYSQSDMARRLGLTEGRVTQIMRGLQTRCRKRFERKQHGRVSGSSAGL